MKIFPLIIAFLCAISLQGCGGGGGGGGSSTPIPPSPEPAPSKITHLDLEQKTTPQVLGDGDIVFGEQITFALWAQESNSNVPAHHVVDNVKWSISDPSLLAPTKKDGRVVFGSFTASTTAKKGGKVTLTATVTNPDGTKVETHVILNVVELEPYNIDIIKMNDTSDTSDNSEDDVPEGFKSSVIARVHWNNDVYTTDKTKVQWVLTGSAFKGVKNPEKIENGFTYEPQDLDTTQIGDTSELRAKLRGVTSDPLTLRVASPTLKKIVITPSNPYIGRDVDLPIRTDLSTSVPRGLTVSFSARAFFDGDWSDRDVTDQVIWESTNSKDFVENKNAFHAVGNPTKQTDITAHIDGYPEIKSNPYNLKITNAQLTKIKVALKQGESKDVPRYISRTLKVTGTFNGDDTDGNAQSFNEDISGSVECESNSPAFTQVDKVTPTRFRAVGEPNKSSTITCRLPSSKLEDSVDLTVVNEDIIGVSVKTDPFDVAAGVPQNQKRTITVQAQYQGDGGTQSEDVTNDATIKLTNNSDFSLIGRNTVIANGAIGAKTSVHAIYRGKDSSNDPELTINEKVYSNLSYDGLVYFPPPPDTLMTWSEANDYCKKSYARLPTYKEMSSFTKMFKLGPQLGWPYTYVYADGSGNYWTSKEGDKAGYHVYQNAESPNYEREDDDSERYSVTCVMPDGNYPSSN